MRRRAHVVAEDDRRAGTSTSVDTSGADGRLADDRSAAIDERSRDRPRSTPADPPHAASTAVVARRASSAAISTPIHPGRAASIAASDELRGARPPRAPRPGTGAAPRERDRAGEAQQRHRARSARPCRSPSCADVAEAGWTSTGDAADRAGEQSQSAARGWVASPSAPRSAQQRRSPPVTLLRSPADGVRPEVDASNAEPVMQPGCANRRHVMRAMTCPSCGAAVRARRALLPARAGTRVASRRRARSGASSRCCSPTSSASPRLAEQLDPEQVKRLIDSCVRAARRRRHDVRRAGRQDARRRHPRPVRCAGRPRGRCRAGGACRRCGCSRRWRAYVDERSASTVPLQMRIGINTGEVLVGIARRHRLHGDGRRRQHRVADPGRGAARRRARRRDHARAHRRRHRRTIEPSPAAATRARDSRSPTWLAQRGARAARARATAGRISASSAAEREMSLDRTPRCSSSLERRRGACCSTCSARAASARRGSSTRCSRRLDRRRAAARGRLRAVRREQRVVADRAGAVARTSASTRRCTGRGDPREPPRRRRRVDVRVEPRRRRRGRRSSSRCSCTCSAIRRPRRRSRSRRRPRRDPPQRRQGDRAAQREGPGRAVDRRPALGRPGRRRPARAPRRIACGRLPFVLVTSMRPGSRGRLAAGHRPQHGRVDRRCSRSRARRATSSRSSCSARRSTVPTPTSGCSARSSTAAAATRCSCRSSPCWSREEGPTSELPDSLRALIAARLDQLTPARAPGARQRGGARRVGAPGQVARAVRRRRCTSRSTRRSSTSLDSKGFLALATAGGGSSAATPCARRRTRC